MLKVIHFLRLRFVVTPKVQQVFIHVIDVCICVEQSRLFELLVIYHYVSILDYIGTKYKLYC